MTETLPEKINGTAARGAQGVDLLAVAQQADRIKDLGRTLIASGLLPESVRKPEAALLIMLKAQEIGIGPVYGLNHITVVKGKPTLSAELMRALVMRAGHKIRAVELTDEVCTLEGERGDDPGHPQRYTFSMDDARKAGLAGNHSWKKYPKAMLSARATSALCRLMFPDAIAGASYTMEELGAEVNEDGEIVDGQPVVEDHPESKVETAEVVEESGLAAKEQDRLRFLIENTGHSVEAFEREIGSIGEISSDTGLYWIKRLGRELQDASEEAGEGSWEPDDEVPEHEQPHDVELDEEDLEAVENLAGNGQRGSTKARKSQVDLLKALAEELRGQDGVTKLEERIGKPLSELTRAEADNWIDRLTPEED